MDSTLYKWQETAQQRFNENSRHGIIKAVTGSGKTRLAVSVMMQMARQDPDLRIRIVVPTLVLAAQWGRAVRAREKDLGRPGYYHGESKSHAGHMVTIYVINSARYAISRHILSDMKDNKHVLLICDECHHYTGGENRKIFDFLQAKEYRSELYSSLGLSATPGTGSDDQILTEALGNVIYDYRFSEAKNDRTISDFVIANTAVSFNEKELASYAEITEKLGLLYKKLLWMYPFLQSLSQEALAHAIKKLADEAGDDPEDPYVAYRLLLLRRKLITIMAESRYKCAQSLIERLDPESRIIVFCERIEQAETFYASLRHTHYGRCALYHSKMTREARNAALSTFREGCVRILISCKALDEGIDVPDAAVGIILSSTSMQRQRIQRLGRIIRRAEGKSAACLYYLYVRESAEDPCYLSEEPAGAMFWLRYYHTEDFFSQEDYESAAIRLLHDTDSLLSSEELAELRACLLEGITRPDYQLPEGELRAKIAAGRNRHEKNYWIAMLKLQGYMKK